MPANLSLPELYDYDSTIFDGFVLPDGMDRDVALAAVLWEASPFEALYPDPTICRMRIAAYSKARLPVWTKLYKSTTADYDPLGEFERTTDEERTGQDVRSPNLTSEGQNGGTDSTTQEVSAFNSSDFQPREKQTTKLGTTNKMHTSGTETTDREDILQRTEKGRNIPAQELLMKERQISMFDIYHFIARDMTAELCIMVY